MGGFAHGPVPCSGVEQVYKTCPCFPQVSAPIWSLARKSCGISSLRRCYTTVKQPIWKSCDFFGLCCTLATLELPNCLTPSSEHGPLRNENRSEERRVGKEYAKTF